jgi:hypothetical protein
VSLITNRETLWSEIYPGNRHTVQCLEPAVLATEALLQQTVEQRKRTVWRLDGGSGSEERLKWLLHRDYQIVAKGMSGRRAEYLAGQVTHWHPYDKAFLGEIAPPGDFGRPVHCYLKRRLKEGAFVHSYYISSLPIDAKGRFMALYDARGAAEVEQFRSDKSGLSLEARRKHSFNGQKGYVLLNDMVHNLLSDFYFRVLIGSSFNGFGLKRIVRDLLAFPGRLTFNNGQLKRVELLSGKQFAKDLAICLERFCSDH